MKVSNAEARDELLDRLLDEVEGYEAKVRRLERRVKAAQEEAESWKETSDAFEQDVNYVKADVRALEAKVAELEKRPVETPDVAALQKRLKKAEAEVEFMRVDHGTLLRQAQDLGTARKDCDTWAARCEEAEEIIRGFLQGHNPVDRAKSHLRGYGERVA